MVQTTEIYSSELWRLEAHGFSLWCWISSWLSCLLYLCMTFPWCMPWKEASSLILIFKGHQSYQIRTLTLWPHLTLITSKKIFPPNTVTFGNSIQQEFGRDTIHSICPWPPKFMFSHAKYIHFIPTTLKVLTYTGIKMSDFQWKSGHFGHYVRRLYCLNLFGLASATALEDKVFGSWCWKSIIGLYY